MIEALKPEVVGHLDLVRKNGHLYGALDTPPIRKAAEQTLEVARAHTTASLISTLRVGAKDLIPRTPRHGYCNARTKWESRYVSATIATALN